MSGMQNVVVVGAGLAGLLAGATAARRGADVTVVDGSSRPGGRAQTLRSGGFAVNLGVHAVYLGGEFARTLEHLGVEIPGSAPDLAQSALIDTSSGDSILGPWVPTLLANPPRQGQNVSEWFTHAGLPEGQMSRAMALIRTITYVPSADVLDAVAAHRQLTISTRGGALYVHGGWSTLVTRLQDALTEAHGAVRLGSRAVRVHHDGDKPRAVELGDGLRLPADAVIIASGSPERAAGLIPEPIGETLVQPPLVPIRLAALDVTLNDWPEQWPVQFFGDGDDPRYWLEQSAYAQIAPPRGAVVHVSRYLQPGERARPSAIRQDLEHLFDDLRPGWRQHVHRIQFLPSLIVSHYTPLAESGGLAARPSPQTGLPGVALAGDWVGDTGLLADAAAASAVAAVDAVLDASRHVAAGQVLNP